MSLNSLPDRTKSVLTVLICLGLVILAVVIMATAAQGAARFITTPIGYAPPKPAPVLTWRVTPVDMRVVKALRAPRPAPVAPTRLPDATGRVNWDALAGCESGGDWAINTGNGYYGGIQMTHGNWKNHKPDGAPAYAHQASKQQQIYAAEGILSEQGRGAWPPLGRAECN